MSDKTQQQGNGAVIKTIKQFLSSNEKNKLSIPVYQRPYRWTEENITDLLTDLYYQCDRIGYSQGDTYNKDNAYRLGTVVLHRKLSNELNLVDGQQRTLTLMLILKAAQKYKKFESQLKEFELAKIELPNCTETYLKLSQNLEIIERHVSSPEFTQNVLDFLLNQCEVVQVVLSELSEAFQFFDSQNARGLDLSPHDLLKAFHLREFPEAENPLKESVVDQWEKRDTKDLKILFTDYLYPIRCWAIGKDGRGFSKNDIHVFKGVNLNVNNYPFQQGLNVIHKTVDSYNHHSHRKLDNNKMLYPFNVNQTMINGRRFFEWVSHYLMLITPLLDREISLEDNDWLVNAFKSQDLLIENNDYDTSRPTAFTILQVLNNQLNDTDTNKYSYSHWWRQGDRYVRRLFNALVLCYYDRFGDQQLARAIEYIFIWAYSLRLKQSSVYQTSIEKHVRENNLFIHLQQSLTPADFINKPLPPISEFNSSHTTGIEILFEQLGYYKK